MLSIYDDTSSNYWGRQFHQACHMHDMPSRIFRQLTPDSEPESLYFCRPEQRDPKYGTLWAMARNCPGIQSIPACVEYERKDLQYTAYTKFMPESFLVSAPEQLERVYKEHVHNGASHFRRCVVKLPHGSGSRNVFIVHELSELRDIAHRVRWISGQHALVQRLIPELMGVWRATRVGNGFGWLYFNHNRSHEAKASGSGIFTPGDDKLFRSSNAEAKLVWDFANTIWDLHGQKWGGLDIAIDGMGKPLLLETTLAWGLAVKGAHRDSLIIDANMVPVLRDGNVQYGRDQWRFLIDRIRAGDFT